VPGKGFLLLTDAEAGKVLAVSLFANEDDYRQGDETLNAMSPPGEGMGRRVGVEKYEVAVQAEA
jgi:predicted RNA-binding protein with EMAP domain